MKDLNLEQAKILEAAAKISKTETKKQFLVLKEQINNLEFAQGPVGPAGPTGSKGDTSPSIVGATGPQGEKGEQGDKGITLHEADIFEDKLILNFTDGEKIDVGKVVGPRGGQGKQGVIGEEGPIGVKGLRGELGPIGPQGVKGDKGDKGDLGNTGDTGPIGLQGNVGTKGDQGERGQTGQSGTTGTAGTPGGPVGPIGSRGEKGPAGPIGPEGPEGPDGRLVDLKPLQTELEDNLKSFKDSISSQVTRLALSGGGGSSGGGEVLLHRLDDVDYNTTLSPTNGQALVYNTTKGKWEANTAAASNSFTTTITTRSIIPSANITYDIGTPLLRYKDIYLSGGTIHAAGATLSANSTGWHASVGGGTATSVQTASSVSGTYVANTAFQSALANTNTFTVRKTGAEQTMQPSLIVANTGIFQQGMPVRQAGGNNVTLALSDNGKLIWCVNTASAMNIHIPTNASVAFPVGAEMTFLQKLTHASANTLGFSPASGVTLDSKEAANTVADRHTAATLKKLATNTWILIGNLS